MTDSTRRWLPPLLLALALIIPACKEEGRERGEKGEHSEGPITYDPVPVKVAAAKTITLQPTLELIGSLAAIPENTAVIAPAAPGVILKLEIAEGAAVRTGQVVAMLDDRAAQNDLAKARASVEEKTAVLAKLQRGALPQEIEAARLDITKFETALQAAKAKLQSMLLLKRSEDVSQVQIDYQQLAVRSAEAEMASAKAKVALLELGSRTEDIAEAQAKLTGAKAELQAAELSLKFTQLISPVDGVAIAVPGRLGQSIDRGAAVATIADLSKLFVQFRIPAGYLGRIQAGSEMELTADAVHGQSFKGAIARLAGQADPATGTLDAFAVVTNEGGRLRPGMTGSITVTLPPIAEALVIPPAAVADRAGVAVVTIIKDNKAREIEIHLGTQTRDWVQVTEGLAAGDRVAIENGYGLPDDCPVKIIEDKPAAAEPAKAP